MVCKLVQMKGGAPPFSVDLRFNAPSSGSTVVTTPSLTVDAQTNGNPGNNGTQTATGTPVTTALVSSAGNSLVKTFAKGKEALATSATLPQHSQFTMPNTLLGGHYGVETSVQRRRPMTPLCDDCPAFVTVLDIPDVARRELAVLNGQPVHVHGHAAARRSAQVLRPDRPVPRRRARTDVRHVAAGSEHEYAHLPDRVPGHQNEGQDRHRRHRQGRPERPHRLRLDRTTRLGEPAPPRRPARPVGRPSPGCPCARPSPVRPRSAPAPPRHGPRAGGCGRGRWSRRPW